MLTRNDVTVPNALEVVKTNSHAKAEYWGFKDVGVTFEQGEELIQAMQAAGKHVAIEPLTFDEEAANKWADIAVKYHIDAFLGRFFPSVSKKLNDAGILYFPPFGRRDANERLLGTIDEIKNEAINLLNQGSSGIRMSAYRDTFCQAEIAAEQHGGSNAYQILDAEAEKVAPGSNGLFFHPYMSGERAPYWDPDLRASFTGFSSLHTRGHFNRAILEGVTYSLKQCFGEMENFGRIDRISFVGGGAKSPLWRSILADVFDRTIVKYRRDDSSLGGAMLTGVAIGVFSSHEEAVRKTAEIDCVTEPDPANVEIYKKYFPLYVEIHDDLADTYKKFKE